MQISGPNILQLLEGHGYDIKMLSEMLEDMQSAIPNVTITPPPLLPPGNPWAKPTYSAHAWGTFAASLLVLFPK